MAVCTRPFAPGHCHTCGGPIEGKRRFWYCRKECRHTYWVNHYWREAREECLRLAGGKCSKCGGLATQAHHIAPLNGGPRHDSCLNHQDNLQALCHDCHRLFLGYLSAAPIPNVLCLSNGRVAWELGKGRLAQWYRDAIYLPPDGWCVMVPPADWVRGVCGELRRTVEVPDAT